MTYQTQQQQMKIQKIHRILLYLNRSLKIQESDYEQTCHRKRKSQNLCQFLLSQILLQRSQYNDCNPQNQYLISMES